MREGGIYWMKLPIVGMPGTQCGMVLEAGGTSRPAEDFKADYPCDKHARWAAGSLLVCQEHAAVVAAEFGDDIADIERAWREQAL